MTNTMTQTLKGLSDIDDSDEAQEVTAAKITMKINRPVCVTWNQILALKIGV